MTRAPKQFPNKVLQGKIALVAGATRGAGRGIAIALGEAGATVYCTGRSSRKGLRKNSKKLLATPGLRETIEETAELVTAAGGHGIAVKVDHESPAEVKKLAARIKRQHKGLDILVNDVWGGDALTEWSKPFWTVNLENGLKMLKQAVHSHIITAHYAAPLMLGRKGGIIFEITDGDAFYYRGNLFYDLVKISAIRLAFAMSRELRKRGIASIALTPGFLRSERVLEHFKVTEDNWKDVGKNKDRGKNSGNQNDAPNDFMVSESPRYIGRAIVTLASDPKVMNKTGRVFSSWALAREYGFTDLDGTQPHWGNYARKKYGKYKICDDTFYSYWVPGLVELIFPDWF
ncbi:MAG TPA: SDR family oxidoreductase [Candidatus Polarisedimenticolia bacterium]|nr:SDR family oxidoreductase [Candidatus Polarisedimenticolia bacterium]